MTVTVTDYKKVMQGRVNEAKFKLECAERQFTRANAGLANVNEDFAELQKKIAALQAQGWRLIDATYIWDSEGDIRWEEAMPFVVVEPNMPMLGKVFQVSSTTLELTSDVLQPIDRRKHRFYAGCTEAEAWAEAAKELDNDIPF